VPSVRGSKKCGFCLIAAGRNSLCYRGTIGHTNEYTSAFNASTHRHQRVRTIQKIARLLEEFVNSFAISSVDHETAIMSVTGDWSIREHLPSLEPFRRRAQESPQIRRVAIDASKLQNWDSALLSFLFLLEGFCREHGISFDGADLPAGARRLIALASASPQRTAEHEPPRTRNFVRRLGEAALRKGRALREPVAFIGESATALARFVIGRARCRWSDILLIAQECGAQALPIVGIISLLVGMILAFVGALQLKQFGADIYDANLVAVAMTREMGAIMTGIVLAGRTGAAFAAQIGAMQGNEEIDALSTFGISAMEFLVLPRMLALIVMTPLLCIYADALGIAGGYVVAMGTLNVTSAAYLLQTQGAITVGDCAIGIVKGGVFGILVAVTGCLRGMQAGRSAAAVGAAATSAVVSGILAIIITDAIFAVVLNVLGW
jgi:phospholipid/cholesterol/gamma-HCH transport system permease protein